MRHAQTSFVAGEVCPRARRSALAVAAPNLAQTEKKTDPAAEQPKAKTEAATVAVVSEPTVFNSQPSNLLGGNNDVWSVAFAPDGKRLAVGDGFWDRTGSVSVWDVGTRKRLITAAEPRGVASVAVSPDGKRLASANWAGEGKVRDLATGKELARLPLGGGAHLAFSPDNKLLATADEQHAVKLWDAVDGKEIANLKGVLLRWHCLAISRDGKWVAAGGGDEFRGGLNQVTIWDVADAPTGRQAGRPHAAHHRLGFLSR